MNYLGQVFYILAQKPSLFKIFVKNTGLLKNKAISILYAAPSEVTFSDFFTILKAELLFCNRSRECEIQNNFFNLIQIMGM